MKRWCTIFVVLYLTLTISGCAYAESRENCDSLFIFLRFSFNSFNFCQLSHSAQHTKLDFRRMLIVHYAFRTVSYVAYRTSVSCLNELLKLFPQNSVSRQISSIRVQLSVVLIQYRAGLGNLFFFGGGTAAPSLLFISLGIQYKLRYPFSIYNQPTKICGLIPAWQTFGLRTLTLEPSLCV